MESSGALVFILRRAKSTPRPNRTVSRITITTVSIAQPLSTVSPPSVLVHNFASPSLNNQNNSTR